MDILFDISPDPQKEYLKPTGRMGLGMFRECFRKIQGQRKGKLRKIGKTVRQ